MIDKKTHPREQGYGSQGLAGDVHTYAGTAHRCRHSSGCRCRAAKCWQVVCILMVTLNDK